MKYIVGTMILAGFCLTPLAADKAPVFTLKDLEGKTFSLQDELGKGPMVFDFWATWCKPCIKGLGKMQEIEAGYRAKGVRVYTINIDGPRNQAKIRPFLRRYRLTLPVLLDKTSELMKAYHLVGVPTTLIIGADGELVYQHQGYTPGDEKKVRTQLDKLLAPAAPQGGVKTNPEAEAEDTINSM
jgi:cytochrome c biogenesis protein CcmG/thiol:disulfide interchange protein DsbE